MDALSLVKRILIFFIICIARGVWDIVLVEVILHEDHVIFTHSEMSRSTLD